MSAYWDKAVRITPVGKPILELPEHIKSLPDDEQGDALVKEMHALIGWRPADDKSPGSVS